MNSIIRFIWSQITNTWIAVAEFFRGQDKKGNRKLALVIGIIAWGAIALGDVDAAPADGQVTSGAGTINQAGDTTTINQATPNLSLSWGQFNIAPHEVVNFVQPSASAIAVNRIFDTSATQIMGQLNANGQIYLINPNGIVFGQGSQVNVGGLVASTLNITDDNLNSATKTFSGDGTGSVINQGKLVATTGGYIALLGNHVSNQGIISAQLGTVALAAGSAMTLTFADNSLVQLQVTQSTLNNLVENKQLIQANGGLVFMDAGAKASLLASVVNNTGIIEAKTVSSHEGVITLLGGMAAGTVNVGGTLDASAPNGGKGGLIETSASTVNVSNSASVSTFAANGKSGTWTIDPKDFTIAASGGNMTGTAVNAALVGGNLAILSSAGSNSSGAGDINVNEALTWNSNQLALTAAHSINVNAVMSVNGTGSLAMNTSTANGTDAAVLGGAVNMGFNPNGSFKGQVNFDRVGTGFLTINSHDYTIINSLGVAQDATVLPSPLSLQGLAAASMNGYYAIGSNINAADTATWNSGLGFTPIGKIGGLFNGTLDGLGHTISDLTINSPAVSNVGLLGAGSTSASISNIGLSGGSIIGATSVGTLLGSNTGNVSNSYATTVVSGISSVGGLMGSSTTGTVSNSHATGNVTGGSIVGGLMGSNTGTVINSYATGNISGTSIVGGLMGSTTTALVSYSYATGNVTGTSSDIGGLAGTSSFALNNSYATGNVSGTTGVGSLIGTSSAAVNNIYATGSATGTSGVGGLIGTSSGAVSNAYASGKVTGTAGVGALIGTSSAALANSYWNSDTAGVVVSVGTGTDLGIKLNSSQMMMKASFTTLDIANVGSSSAVWRIYDGATMPLLRSYLTPITLSSAYTGPATAITSISDYTTNIANPISANIISTAAGLTLSSTTTAGTQTALLNNFSSIEQGYDISYAPTTITGTGSAANDLNIGQTIDWSSGALNLIAQSNINFNATLNGSGSAKLALSYGQSTVAAGNSGDYIVHFDFPVNLPSGSNFTTQLGSNGVVKDYTVITTLGIPSDATTAPVVATLQGIAATANLTKNFVLGSNINATDTSGASWLPTGFKPIGILGTAFQGWFDGLGHTVSGLYTNIDATADAGLFGYSTGSTLIQNVGLLGGSVFGGAASGGLVGYNDAGLIRNSYNTGTVNGGAFTGGLVGQNISGSIINSYSTGKVVGAAYTGGLVGATTTGNITSSYSTGAVHGAAGTGGLVGIVTTGIITGSYATGTVWGGAGTGGLVGTTTGAVSTSYATGNVRGTTEGTESGFGAGVGGLVGTTTAKVTNTYATGAVDGQTNVGGLIGHATGSVSNSYAVGSVTGVDSTTTGAFMGSATVTNTNNFYNSEINGTMPGVGAQSILGGVTGKSTVDMKLQTTFTNAGWDFTTTPTPTAFS